MCMHSVSTFVRSILFHRQRRYNHHHHNHHHACFRPKTITSVTFLKSGYGLVAYVLLRVVGYILRDRIVVNVMNRMESHKDAEGNQKSHMHALCRSDAAARRGDM
uniref:Uncharacterized protein n=1 Tax=Glossina brevipalpis TaxID=37001 RepID=A0A1A9WHL1_9MUSC